MAWGSMRGMVVETNSPKETEQLAGRVAARLAPGVVIGLSGELGSGKTCFVRGLARGLGCATPVTSPTFVFLHVYEGRLTLRHYDLYRIAEGREILELGFEEFRDDGVSVIEWVERIPQPLLGPHVHVRISILEPARRRFEIEPAWGFPGDMWENIRNALDLNG